MMDSDRSRVAAAAPAGACGVAAAGCALATARPGLSRYAPLAGRLAQLYLALAAYGLAMALLIRADLGLNPWDVLHDGAAARTGLSFGTVVLLTGAAALLLWIPLRQRPGLGTLSNLIVVSLAVDGALQLLPEVELLLPRLAMLPIGTLLCGVAAAAYLGTGFGPGPRDGLMTGIAASTGWPIAAVRTSLEAAALAIGWLLGGGVGLGTLLFAGSIGPLIQYFLPKFTWKPAACAPRPLPPLPRG